jgi:DNA-binding transcriptional LysR family regulator
MPGRDRWIAQLCRKAGFRPKFAQQAGSVSELFSLIAGEDAVAIVPGYMKDSPAAGVALVPIADAGATWDFLVVWQRGKTAAPVRALIDALSATLHSEH